MVKIKVHMLAFGKPDEVREVEIEHPSLIEDCLLDQVFEYGQNQFNPLQEHPSVSAGDVIELDDGKLFLIQAVGFKEMHPLEFADYKSMPRRDRMFYKYLLD